MTGDFYYCNSCDLAYREDGTDLNLPGPRTCSVCTSPVSLIPERDIDLSIFDYLGERG